MTGDAEASAWELHLLVCLQVYGSSWLAQSCLQTGASCKLPIRRLASLHFWQKLPHAMAHSEQDTDYRELWRTQKRALNQLQAALARSCVCRMMRPGFPLSDTDNVIAGQGCELAGCSREWSDESVLLLSQFLLVGNGFQRKSPMGAVRRLPTWAYDMKLSAART